MIHGRNPVWEALRAGRRIEAVYIQKRREDWLITRLEQTGAEIVRFSREEMDERFGEGHQGFAAKVEPYREASLDAVLAKGDASVFLMLDGVEDPHNFGAVLRSAEVFGADGVIVQKRRSAPLSAAAVKVSAGAVEHVEIIRETNLNQAILKLQSKGFWIIGLEMETDLALEAVPVDMPLCLILGSEHKGLRSSVRKKCDFLAHIPMQGRLNSLNVSVSAGIALYDVTRRKGSHGKGT